MAFDLASAKPVASKGFDIASAKPVVTVDPVDVANADPTEGNSFAKNSVIGLGSAIDDLALRGKQAYANVADFVAPRERKLSDLVTGGDPSRAAEVRAQIDEKQRLNKPLMDTAGGKTGNFVGKAAPAVAAAFVPGGQTLAGSMLIGAGSGAAEPTGTGQSTLNNTAVGAVGGGVGYGVGKGLSALASMARNKASAAAVQNGLTDANTVAAREAGYSIPPSQSNPGSTLANTLDIAAGGRPKMSQAASLKNQEVTNALAAKALGLPPGEPITQGALDQVRAAAFKNGYEPIRQAGTITPGAAYDQALDKIVAQSKGAARSFPGAVSEEIPNLVKGLRVGKFDAGDAVDMTRVLRETADKAYRSGDNALGKAAKDASKALEDAIENHLQNISPDAVAAFRNARQLMAKTYSVGNKALNTETGNVSAQELARQLSNGKPLSGELLDIAKAAKLSPTNMRTMAYTTPGGSQLEAAGSAGAAVASGNPAYLVLPYARAGMRKALLSSLAGKTIGTPSYGGSATLNALGSQPSQIGLQTLGELARPTEGK